ncbi:MAG TPA: branched-chain amino acid aminotransferase, partial [Bacteroidetes bacterium]|nr:branched-chain amino acid aminotransferase [Bacteroidota bacterium]
YTPETGNILPGITRKTIMELCSELGILVKETKLLPQDVLRADAAFFTGTAAEVVGIKSVNDYEMPLAWEDSLGYLLARRYQKLVRQEDEAFTLV